MINFRNIKGDFLGGLVVALLSLPINIPLGALALAPLGPNFLAIGVSAGLTASIVTGTVSAITGGSRLQISGPRSSLSLVMASAITIAINNHVNPYQAMAIGFLVVLFAGLTQILMGLARLGAAIKYLPYPVMAGFINGVAILVIVSQLPAALGLESTLKWSNINDHIHEISIASLIVALVTMLVYKLSEMLTTKISPIIISFIVGMSFDKALRNILGDNSLGPLVGYLNVGLPSPDTFIMMISLPWSTEMPSWLLSEIYAILILALLGSTESLLSAAVIDSETGDNHDCNQELIGQGLGNAIGACFGCIPCAGAPIRGPTSFKVGGNSRLAAIFHSIILLCLLIWGKSFLASLSFSVMAGLMIMVSASVVDFTALKKAYTYGRFYLIDCVLMIFVTSVSVLINLVAGTLCGFIAASVIFILHSSKPIISRISDRTIIKSLRRRPLYAENYLFHHGRQIVIIEMEGPLFFGTAEKFREELSIIQKKGPRFIILDFSRINYLDISGAYVMSRILNGLANYNSKIFICGIQHGDFRVQSHVATFIKPNISSNNMFLSLDRAIECAENTLLTGLNQKFDADFDIVSLELFAGLDESDIRLLAQLLTYFAYRANEIIFNLGDNGDGLYILASGTVEIYHPGSNRTRFATLTPGTIFGEMCFLDRKQRSASAVTLEPSSVYWLSRENFTVFQNMRPASAIIILKNIGCEMSERLRLADFRLQGKSLYDNINV